MLFTLCYTSFFNYTRGDERASYAVHSMSTRKKWKYIKNRTIANNLMMCILIDIL